MSEFKISRLRFSWVGEWTDQTAYNKDEIVQFEGKAYVCLIPHTANAFYTDLGNVEPRWELMMTGQTWKGVWTAFTNYALDNIVIFGGIVYKCNEQHLSTSVIDPDIDKWDIYAESKTWASEWTSSTSYGPGDIVNYGGSAYECTVAHISAETDLLGLEDDYTQVDDSTEKYWKITTEGVQWRGEYNVSSDDSTQVRYKLNDLVKYGPSIYECIRGHAPAIPDSVQYGVYQSTALTVFGGTVITYVVTVASGTNQYGTGNKYYIEGQSGASPTLSLARGTTYRFDQSDPSNATHQLLFSATPNGVWNGGGVEYTTGVTKVGTAGTAGAYTQITVPDDAPALYYYCIAHSGMGGTAIAPQAATYSIAPASSNVDEGTALLMTVTTTNVADSTELWWSLTNASDFGSSTGSLILDSNSGDFFVTPTADTTTEGAETFQVQLRSDSPSGAILATSSTITINDTSLTPGPTYALSSSADNIDEGSSLTIQATTTNVTEGTTLYWTIANNLGDFGTTSGNFAITGNNGSFTVTPTADATTEGAATFSIQLRTGSASGPIVDTLDNLTINDTSVGAAADYTINVTNNGASAYTLSGSDGNGAVSGDNQALTFTTGDVVDFVVNAAGHPFYVKTSATTGTNDQVTEGIINNGASNGTVRWTVGTSGTYYYICEFHSSMVGTITV